MRSNGIFRSGLAGSILTMAALALLRDLRLGRHRDHRRRAHPERQPAAAGQHRRRPRRRTERRRADLVAAETTPRKSFYFGYRYPRLSYTIGSTQPQNDLRIDVVNAADEVVKTFYREDVAPDVANTIRWDGTTDEGKPARNGRYSFRISPQTAGAPAARKASTSTTPQPRLHLLRLRLPDPRPPRIQHGRRPLRRRPLRPHPPGPGRDGRLRHAAGRRPRRQGPVRRLPVRRRQLRRDRRQGHPQRLHVRPPRRTLAAAHRRHRPHRPADRHRRRHRRRRRPATSTSRCGAHPAGTRAALPSTPWPNSKSGTSTASRDSAWRPRSTA